MNNDPNGGFHNGPSWDFLVCIPAYPSRSMLMIIRLPSLTRARARTQFLAIVCRIAHRQICSSDHAPDLPVMNRTNLRVMTESQGSKIIWSSSSTRGLMTASGVEYVVFNESGVPETRTIARPTSANSASH